MSREGTGKMLGARVRRVEDPRVLLGKTQYVDDLVLPDMLAVAFVRSPYAHAKIEHIDVQTALAKPEVQCVLTGRDILNTIKPLRVEFDTEKVPFHKSCNWHSLLRWSLRGRLDTERQQVPSLDRAAEICEAIGFELHIGPFRGQPSVVLEDQGVYRPGYAVG